MTWQPWTTSKLAQERIADLERAAWAGRRPDEFRRHRAPSPVALGTARLLLAAGWRLGGTRALPASLRRRLA